MSSIKAPHAGEKLLLCDYLCSLFFFFFKSCPFKEAEGKHEGLQQLRVPRTYIGVKGAMSELCIHHLDHLCAGCVSHRRCLLLPRADKLRHVRSPTGDEINPVFSDWWWLYCKFVEVLLKNPSLAVYLFSFPNEFHNTEAVLGVGFQRGGDKAFVCSVGNVARRTGERSGTDLIIPRILSTGLSVLRKSTGIF